MTRLADSATLIDALGRGPIVLDGGLGTLLESRGHDLGSDLWSARLLLERPEEIRAAHREYFEAGARVGITASYQVTYEGLARAGIGAAETSALLRRSVELAVEARDEVAGDGVERWVAASVGPYGAMLADGSEYRGDYGLDVDALRRWHRPRLAVLADTAADLLAVETIPCVEEVKAVALELHELAAPAWVSVTAAMGALRSGDDLREAYAFLDDIDEVVAVGINCSDPLDVNAAIEAARAVTAKPVVVYPNSGEQWDAKNRRWMGDSDFPDWLIREWVAAGASLIGGCCRVGPLDIAGISRVLGT